MLLWTAVVATIVAALLLDLLVFHRDPHEVDVREAARASAAWIALGLAFGLVVWRLRGGASAGEYYAGYLIEKALSVENVFVFALILGWFRVPKALQHRVLFFGVLGALVLRGLFIAAGKQLLESFHATIYLFGALLIVTAVKMLRHDEMAVDPARSRVLRLMRRFVPMSDDFDGARFFTVRDGVRLATPMLAVVAAVETSDVVFAIDSIPAVFAVTADPFIVFTSNAFAILGLRALYFLLAGVMDRLVHLKTGLAAVLALVGVKMLVSAWWHVPIAVSLGAIAAILAVATVTSLRATRVDPGAEGVAGAAGMPDNADAEGDAVLASEGRTSAPAARS